jgi:hypothetical protein
MRPDFSWDVTSYSGIRPGYSWNLFVTEWVKQHQLPGTFAILTQQPTATDPSSNHRMEIINL